MSVPEPDWNPMISEPPSEVPLPNAPLVRVLAQLRFSEILSIEKREFVAPFQEALREQYPMLKHEKTQNIIMGPKGPSVSASASGVWRFSDLESGWRVSLSPDFVALETSSYTSRDDFIARLSDVLEMLAETIGPKVIERLGVRYIDRVESPHFEKVRSLIREPILGVGSTQLWEELRHSISESVFGIAETNAALKARWGVLPAQATIDPAVFEPIDSPSWLLDLDAFRQEQRVFDPEELSAEARRYAERIYSFFRWAVTDEFLKAYGGEL